MRRHLVLVLLAGLAATCVLAAAPRASAAHGVQYGLTDDAWLEDGPGTLASRVAQLDALGVAVVRITLHWDQIAPTRPTAPDDPTDAAYDWSATDATMAALRARGIEPLLQLVG